MASVAVIVAVIFAAYFVFEIVSPAQTDRGELFFTPEQYADDPESNSVSDRLP